MGVPPPLNPFVTCVFSGRKRNGMMKGSPPQKIPISRLEGPQTGMRLGAPAQSFGSFRGAEVEGARPGTTSLAPDRVAGKPVFDHSGGRGRGAGRTRIA